MIGGYLITFGWLRMALLTRSLSQFIGNWINPFSHLFPQQLVNPPWEVSGSSKT